MHSSKIQTASQKTGLHGMAINLLVRSVSRGCMMEKFRVVVWCESCRGDDEGCFGGGNEVIQGAFESFEAAEQAGLHYCADLPYQYRIVHAGPV